jgi:hypothetical protein
MKRMILLLCGWSILAATAAAQQVAVFPLGGDAPQAARDRIGFSIRAKLDREGTYTAIDGPDMADLAAAAQAPLTFNTPAATVRELAQGSGAIILIWGEASAAGGKTRIRLKTLDLRSKEKQVRSFTSDMADPIELRQIVEKFLQNLPGVKPFTQPNQLAVHHDRQSDALFAANPNLLVNGDFASGGHWLALYQSQQYPPPPSDALPPEDHVVIDRSFAGAQGRHPVLAMNLSLQCAQNNGLACLSDPIPIQPGVRYRLAFRYRSDGPHTHVLVKGYALATNLAGQPAEREVYRLQVPPGGSTGGRWVTVQADVNPHNPDSPVQQLRIDLYAYLNPGTVMFDDVVLKAVGRQNPPATQPAGR